VIERGPSWWVKLGDFGVAKRVANEMTRYRTSIDTDFTAPEIIGFPGADEDEATEYTNAVDMWSLGCLVHWLLTLDLPLKRKQIYAFHIGKLTLPVDRLQPFSAAVIDFITKLLRPQAKLRDDASTILAHEWLSNDKASIMPNPHMPMYQTSFERIGYGITESSMLVPHQRFQAFRPGYQPVAEPFGSQMHQASPTQSFPSKEPSVAHLVSPIGSGQTRENLFSIHQISEQAQPRVPDIDPRLLRPGVAIPGVSYVASRTSDNALGTQVPLQMRPVLQQQQPSWQDRFNGLFRPTGLSGITQTKERTRGEGSADSSWSVTGDDEVDFDAIEAEMAALDAEELRREEVYQRKKAIEREERRKLEEAEAAAYERNLSALERKAEEEEDAHARANAKNENVEESFAALKSSPSEVGGHGGSGTQPENVAAELSTIDPAESGTATPVSDDPLLPPPLPPPRATGRRRKATELTLVTKKPVEPPEPSAALISLQLAKYLDDLSKVSYPPDIASPNPALNANAPSDRKFKYDKEFLLQFQVLCKEKPCPDWYARLRDVLGL
jgi:hypothetical protein